MVPELVEGTACRRNSLSKEQFVEGTVCRRTVAAAFRWRTHAVCPYMVIYHLFWVIYDEVRKKNRVTVGPPCSVINAVNVNYILTTFLTITELSVMMRTK